MEHELNLCLKHLSKEDEISELSFKCCFRKIGNTVASRQACSSTSFITFLGDRKI